jgi:hypothetical protein
LAGSRQLRLLKPIANSERASDGARPLLTEFQPTQVHLDAGGFKPVA